MDNSLTRARLQGDTGLDWLFAQARRYPLLTTAQELAIDQRKWRAVGDLQDVFLADTQCRALLGALVTNLVSNPPAARDLGHSPHYGLLRREISDYLPGKPGHAALTALHAALAAPDKPQAATALRELQMPAALVAAIASLALDRDERDGVAAGLRDWRAQWPEADTPSRAGERTRRALEEPLGRYLAAREQLVHHNLRLVFSIAGRTPSSNVSFCDLVQEGVFGLLRAAEKFHHRRGYRFSTYAYNWVSQSIRRALNEQEGILRYPTQVMDRVKRLHRERLQHLQYTGREPSTRTLAERLQLDSAEVESLRQLANFGVSLETPQGEEEDSPTLGATLSGGPFPDTAASAEGNSLRRTVHKRMRTLSPTEQRVIAMRWGLEQSPPLSRAQVAPLLGVSTERVRQVEVAALDKLRGDRELAGVYSEHRETGH